MSRSVPDPISVIRASFEVVGHDSWRDLDAPHLPPQPAETLADAIYLRFFQRRGVAEADPRAPGDAGLLRRHVAALEEIALASNLWDARWNVRSISKNEGAEEIVAERDGLLFRFTTDDLAPDLGLDPREECVAAVPTLRRGERPGFLRVLSTYGDVEGDSAPVHLTWNLRPDGVAPWLKVMNRKLTEAELAFRLDMPTDPLLHFGAADVTLSVSGDDLRKLLEKDGGRIFADAHEAVLEFLRPETPLGLHRLGWGVAMGEGAGSVAAAGRRWSRAVAERLLSDDSSERPPRIIPQEGAFALSLPATPAKSAETPREALLNAAAAAAHLRRRETTHWFKGTFLLGRTRRVAAGGAAGAAAQPEFAAAGSLPSGFDDGPAGISLAFTYFGDIVETGTPTLSEADSDDERPLNALDEFASALLDLEQSLFRPRSPQDAVPQDLLDPARGALGVLWAWRRMVELDADVRCVHGATWNDAYARFLEAAAPSHAASARSVLLLLDLADLLGDEGDLARRTLDLALNLGDRLLDDVDDRLFARTWTARGAAEASIAFFTLGSLCGDENFRAAARRTPAYRPRKAVSFSDPAWRLLALQRARDLDADAATSTVRQKDRNENLSGLLQGLRAAAALHDADLTLASGACLMINVALEIALQASDPTRADEFVEAAEDLMRRLLERHGDPNSWPILRPLGASHPSFMHGTTGVLWTMHRLRVGREILAGTNPRDLAQRAPLLVLPATPRFSSALRDAARRRRRSPVSNARRLSGRNFTILRAPLVGQERSFWCWAATEQMIRGFLRPQDASADRTPADQEEIVAARFKGRLPDRGAWPKFSGLRKHKRRSPLEWREIRAQLDAERPFAFALKNPGSGSHMLAAVGYGDLTHEPEMRRLSTAFPRRWLLVHDPWPPHSGDAYLTPFRHYRRGTNGHKATVLIAPPGASINLGRRGVSRPAGFGGFPSSWEAAQAALHLLRASARLLPERSRDRRRLFLLEPDEPADLRVRRRPIRTYVASLKKLRKLGVRIFDGRAEEEIFPITDAFDRLISSVTVAQSRHGWEIRSVGRRRLAASLVALEQQGFDAERELPSYMAWDQKLYAPPHPTPDFALFIPELYELFLGVNVDWPRRGRVLFPVYGSERLGFAPGEALAADTVFDALARFVRSLGRG